MPGVDEEAEGFPIWIAILEDLLSLSAMLLGFMGLLAGSQERKTKSEKLRQAAFVAARHC